MAYSDFANVVAPSAFWDEAQSGVFSSTSDATPSTLAEAIALVTDSLASRWDGTRYEYVQPEDPPDPAFNDQFRVLLVAPTILACTEIYIDQLSFDSDSPSVTLYGTDGSILTKPGDPMSQAYLLYGKDSEEVAAVEDLELGGFRRMYRLFWGDPFAMTPEPIVMDGIKAILIAGFLDFPQGRPERLYGLYGPVISGETPFWTGFSGSAQANPLTDPSLAFNWPARGQRLTELF